jgi:hypothetical protein
MKKEDVVKRKYEFLHYLVILICGAIIGWWAYDYAFGQAQFSPQEKVTRTPPEQVIESSRLQKALDVIKVVTPLIETITPLIAPFITYFLYRKEKKQKLE